MGAFAVSFLALRDLMQAIGYSNATAWIFPAIIDTAVAVSTIMLVALGDKPARRPRTVTTAANTRGSTAQPSRQDAKRVVTPVAPTRGRRQPAQGKHAQHFASVQPGPAQTMQRLAQTGAMGADAELASELIASGVTTQPVETVIAVLASSRDGASINAAAKASGINYRTAQRIVEAAAELRQGQLVAAS